MEEEVLELLGMCAKDDLRLVGGLENLCARWGSGVYQIALHHLVGKEYDRDKALRYWTEGVRHRQRVPGDFGLRPALLDYLHRVAGEMHDPRILEAGQLEALRQASVTDGLTGLFQQVYFKSFLARELCDRKRRPEESLAVVILDLDHFKQYNDRCGHLTGDLALSRVADILRECTREGDLAARYGGEEFILLLPRVGRRQAFKIAERIRVAIEKAEFSKQELLESGNLTISGGIAVFPEDGNTAEELINEADRQLYQAKVSRNAISPAHRERRRAHRQKMRSVLEIEGPEGLFSPGMTFDISDYGLTLGCGFDVPPGTRIKLRFSEPFWSRTQQMTARVRNLRRDRDNRLVLIGLEFDEGAWSSSPLQERSKRRRDDLRLQEFPSPPP